MIISNNEVHFYNPTQVTSGNLRANTYNELCLGFKPTTVFKRSGYLTVTGSGYIILREPRAIYRLSMEFYRHTFNEFALQIIYETDVPVGKSHFSFHIDIPVGLEGIADNTPAALTTHFNGTTKVKEASAFIRAANDDIYTAYFKYSALNIETNISVADFRVYSIIAEYKEN